MTGMTRRQFFGAMKTAGFSKSRLQMTRNSLTYQRGSAPNQTTVTVPKDHSNTFTILGGDGITGIFLKKVEGRDINWGNVIDPSDLGLNNMLEICIGIVTNNITRRE